MLATLRHQFRSCIFEFQHLIGSMVSVSWVNGGCSGEVFMVECSQRVAGSQPIHRKLMTITNTQHLQGSDITQPLRQSNHILAILNIQVL
ncbi:hypothetical protein DEO72_LG7g1331 [Vigna unguiculata]|uniref:Uncharacterized protein n=1 Tax=Vigna unguiculata TaxID=3917 RepID=A0A4D6MK03_VIGUN|nr:hypothetical protein DEO72_LG7g1331 [Vigna unguiculata]